MTKYAGIYIENHTVQDAASKEAASKSLKNWRGVACSAEDWVKKLEQGQTIQPSAFSPQSDGTFTHKKEFWNSTHFIACDADNIKGIEFLDNGEDKNPNGVEAWTEEKGLSKRFPTLTEVVYAVGQSVSSMSNDKPPHHRRYRLIFLFDEPITSEKHYHQILLTLANEFPIIPAVERSPAQPVFGNAREGFGFHTCGNILKLADYPYKPPTETSTDSDQQRLHLDESLEEFLRRHHISYESTGTSNKFYVKCPYEARHASGKNGPTDAYVFDDGKGWAFYCSHASCANNRTWEAFKEGYQIDLYKGKPDSYQDKRDYQQAKGEEREAREARKNAWTESDIERAEDTGDTDPEFPDDLFFNVFAEYRDAWDGIAPFHDSFLFATCKHAVSAVLGKSVFIESGVRIYPNHYTGLVGASADAQKSTTLSAMQKYILSKADPNVEPLRALATPEGLINLFVEPKVMEAKDDDGNDITYYRGGYADSIPEDRIPELQAQQCEEESVRICAVFSELSTALLKGKKMHAQGLIETLLQLYDCEPMIQSQTKENPTVAEFPTFSMIGASTMILLEESMGTEYIFGGFANRFEWYLTGDPKPAMFLWGMPKQHKLNKVVDKIGKLRSTWCKDGRPTGFSISKEAIELGQNWTEKIDVVIREEENPLVVESVKRAKLHVLKNSLIFAVLTNTPDNAVVGQEHIEKAIALAGYSMSVAKRIFASYASSDVHRVEKRIIEILKNTPLLTAKQTYHKMAWAKFEDVARIIETMCLHGMLGWEKPSRSKRYFVLKDENE